MRWWWFGPAVTKPELRKELELMHGAGIGGVEIQPVYPMALDDPAKGIRNVRYLSPDFLDAVGFANRTARDLGMRVDITLGSGWPYGGPRTTLELAAGSLRVTSEAVAGEKATVPQLGPGDEMIAAFVVQGSGSKFDPATAQRIDTATGLVPPGAGQRTALFFTASHTGQQVKRAAFGAEGSVLDHFNRAAINEHLHDVAEPLLAAFGDQPPYSVFSDSLEVYGSDWTANLPEEFKKRRGYDLIPHLPELVAGGTPEAAAVRHDWGKTLDELICENYLAPLAEFARQHHTLFRSQTYGDPAVTLADQDVPQLIEGEGMQWRKFSYTRWATSAAHLFGRNVVSAETWTWLHSPAFRATPLDMKAEADRIFLLGVNQLVGHGWPYSPESAGEPGYAFYAAAVFNQHNPWFPVMPDIMRYLTRVSWLLRQGKPANDVAILLPEDDAQAAFSPGHVSIVDEMQKRIKPSLMAEVLDAGYNIDYIDAETIDKLGTIPYPVLILPPMERIPLSAYRKIEAYAKSGGRVIAVGETPQRAPGLKERRDTVDIAEISERLFEAPGHVGLTPEKYVVITAEYRPIAELLRKCLPPDLDSGSGHRPTISPEQIGFIHRKLADRDIYFVANTANVPFRGGVRFRSAHRYLEEWNPDDGTLLPSYGLYKEGAGIDLAPYESRIFVLSDEPEPASSHTIELGSARPQELENLSRDWTITFNAAHFYRGQLDSFVSWTRLPEHMFFSGEAIYTRAFSLDSVAPKTSYWLDFGLGHPIADDRPPDADGMHALLDPPIREAAIVYVNGKRAGSPWHPPYRLDITELTHPGTNQLEIHVFNTAMNELAGQPLPDLAPLRGKYGTRFDPQDQDRIQPLPSGLLGAIHLVTQPNH